MQENYKKIMSRAFYDIFIGDTPIPLSENEDFKMPYLSGSSICSIAKIFGLEMDYYNSEKISRWQYEENLLSYLYENEKINDYLKYMFSIKRFQPMIQYEVDRGKIKSNEIVNQYNILKSKVIDYINSLLIYNNYQLIEIKDNYYIKKVDEEIVISTELNVINNEYIRDIYERSIKDINEGNYDSALNKSKTLIEEIFCLGLEKKGTQRETNEDMLALFKKVKGLYLFSYDKNVNDNYVKLLSGMYTIIQSISELRNSSSDAHGVGNKRVDITNYQAIFVVNCAYSFSTFLLDVIYNDDTNES